MSDPSGSRSPETNTPVRNTAANTPLVRKLENFVKLSASEKEEIRRLSTERVRVFQPGDDLVCEGEPPGPVNLVLEGFACRYKILEDGRRQIIGLFVPGDLCDARVFVLKEMDHSICALTTAHVAQIESETLIALSDTSPRVTRALWWNTLVEESMAREWIVNVGRRSALERMAHLLCEFFVRMGSVGLVDGNACDMPLTQALLADALGISAVHTNRTLQTLRSDGLLSLGGGRLMVPDLQKLMDVALFSPNYLHMDRDGAAFDANDR